MSYVDRIYKKVVEQNPGEAEFHQAVKEVLESLRIVIEANEDICKKRYFGEICRGGQNCVF